MSPRFIFAIISFCLCSVCSMAQKVPLKTGSAILQQDAQEALDFHNKVRADVGSPPLQWSEELSGFAQAWADHLATSCNLEHRPYSGSWTQKYGENIFWGSNGDYTPLNASEDWYSEIKEYKYGTLRDDNWYKTGHYTQMVWKSTTHVGIGIAVCKSGALLIVANYSPTEIIWERNHINLVMNSVSK